MGLFSGLASLASGAAGLFGSSEADKARRQSKRQLRNAAFRPISFSGPGGIGGSFNPNTGSLNLGLGALQGGQEGLLGAGLGALGQIGNFDLSPLQELLEAQAGVVGQTLDPNNNLFAGLQGAIGQGLNLAGAGIAGAAGGVAQGVGDAAFAQAGNLFSNIGGGDQARDRALGLLREQARPFEDRAFSNLQDNLFSTGRLGSSGGALQTEAFARGLGQADLSRQLAASQEGRAFDQSQLGLGQGLFGAGAQQRGLSDTLLNNAFSRFGNFANLASDVEAGRFRQNAASQQNLFSQLNTLFGNQQSATALPIGLQGQLLGQAGTAISGAGSLSQIPIQFFQAGLAGEQSRSNAALGVGTGLGQVAQQPNFADSLSSAFSGLAQASDQGLFSGLFGRRSGGPQNNLLQQALSAGVS